MADLIDRQAVIEAFDNLEWFHQNANKDMVSGANSKHHQAWYKEQDVYKTLVQLPSADLDEVYAHAETEAEARFYCEVVRCKDCIFWVAHNKRCVYLDHGFAPNMWCCHGRRRDG